ncbi:MAG: M23 family metallopeptidase [Clostridia bacterium]
MNSDKYIKHYLAQDKPANIFSRHKYITTFVVLALIYIFNPVPNIKREMYAKAEQKQIENSNEKSLKEKLKSIYPPPVKGRIQKPYGTSPQVAGGQTEHHSGVDINAKYRDPVKAIESGIITEVSVDEKLGNVIEIKHSNEYGTFYTFYAKLSSPQVEIGDKVEQGETIAFVEGEGEYASYIHFEVRDMSGEFNDVDPKPYIY